MDWKKYVMSLELPYAIDLIAKTESRKNFGLGCSFSIGYKKTIWERVGMVNRADKNVP